ncbi:MAG: DeoR/GlpR transcriptional regulator [Clostridia bacterium]|nr:DeoR/GlpR transcriptional regulator [Clostridia bacterium]
MLANQRHNKISELLKINGAVDVSELVKLFNVSVETVRKDLLFMENSGLLKRVHGGAVRQNQMKNYENLSKRNEENAELKKELSQKAMQFIEEDDFIAVDGGSTAIFFAEVLKENFKKLTIVTNCKYVFDILGDCEGFNLILCGGHYLKEENAFYGELAINTLKHLHVNKAFIFSSAISLKYGIFDFQKDLLAVQKAYLECADKIYFLADSSKFEKTGLLKLTDIREDFTFITDGNFPNELKKMYLQNNCKVVS